MWSTNQAEKTSSTRKRNCASEATGRVKKTDMKGRNRERVREVDAESGRQR